ncbi:hypothetical protein Bca52824_039626 [Brassica carinata]|uniref:Uncharacterized protein n=1 Tax=Brassica carinata TaxID=52824 RepID=A0A8X7RRY7_BRACI|nr:hypothetical protein Bca52824_039626 [Brassica carinata]
MIACGSSLKSGGDDGFWHALMEAMKTLTAKVGSMDTVITEKMLTAVDTKTDAKVNARVGQTELMQAIAPKNDAHFVNQEDEVNINDPSWMVQDKAPSHLDAAVQCVVRKKAKIPRSS